MKKHTLLWKRTTQVFLLSIMLCLVGVSKASAQDSIVTNNRRAQFARQCPTGVYLWYRIIAGTHTVTLDYPGRPSDPYNGYEAYIPNGPIIIPETIVYKDVTYTVTAIADQTFFNCTGITGSLVIPNTITKIGNQAFYNCTGLTGTLTLGNSVTTIGQSAFEKSGITGDLVIPNSVNIIGNNAFAYCTGLNGTLTLSNNLTKIGVYAFTGCTGLTGPLVIPNSVSELDNGAFMGCSGFNGELTLPENLNRINFNVFNGCSSLTGDLVIPNNVEKIDENAFYGCNGFSEIYIIRETPPELETNTAFTISANTPVYVPYCGLNDYRSATNWTRFTNFKGCSYFINEGEWSNTDNWTCQAAPDETQHAVIVANCETNTASTEITMLTIFKNKALSIQPNTILTVSNTIKNKGNATNLVIEADGQLLHSNNNVLATVKKSINAYSTTRNGWNLISSPIATNTDVTTVENLLSNTNTYDLYYYDEPTHYWINQKITDNNFTELKSGTGYLYANSGNVTLSFAGALKNGSASTTISPLSYQSDLLKGFNLIGNPFAHNVTEVTTVNVVPAFYRMNELASDLMVSNFSATDPLKPAEAFFVKATNDNASVTFNSNTRSETEKTGSICLELMEDGKISDRLLVKRNEGYDFEKFSLRDNRTKLFAVREKKELAIVVCDSNEQTVNFKTTKNGTYTISVTLKDIEVDYLQLIDNLTGNHVDLLVTPTYTFEAKTSDYASRFRLLFSPTAFFNGTDSFAYISNGEINVYNEGIATLQMIDLTGRILSTETINGSFNKPINMSKGVYMLRLINGNDVKTQKIVVE